MGILTPSVARRMNSQPGWSLYCSIWGTGEITCGGVQANGSAWQLVGSLGGYKTYYLLGCI